MQFERKKPSILVSKGKSSSICVSARDAPDDPVLIAGDYGGVPGLSTAARRGDGSHSDDGGCERMISIRKPSTSTFICRSNSSGVCGYSGITMFLYKKGFGTGLVLVRERFSSISAAVSIRS